MVSETIICLYVSSAEIKMILVQDIVRRSEAFKWIIPGLPSVLKRARENRRQWWIMISCQIVIRLPKKRAHDRCLHVLHSAVSCSRWKNSLYICIGKMYGCPFTQSEKHKNGGIIHSYFLFHYLAMSSVVNMVEDWSLVYLSGVSKLLPGSNLIPLTENIPELGLSSLLNCEKSKGNVSIPQKLLPRGNGKSVSVLILPPSVEITHM